MIQIKLQRKLRKDSPIREWLTCQGAGADCGSASALLELLEHSDALNYVDLAVACYALAVIDLTEAERTRARQALAQPLPLARDSGYSQRRFRKSLLAGITSGFVVGLILISLSPPSKSDMYSALDSIKYVFIVFIAPIMVPTLAPIWYAAFWLYDRIDTDRRPQPGFSWEAMVMTTSILAVTIGETLQYRSQPQDFDFYNTIFGWLMNSRLMSIPVLLVAMAVCPSIASALDRSRQNRVKEAAETALTLLK